MIGWYRSHDVNCEYCAVIGWYRSHDVNTIPCCDWLVQVTCCEYPLFADEVWPGVANLPAGKPVPCGEHWGVPYYMKLSLQKIKLHLIKVHLIKLFLFHKLN